ncbi:MAG TPA: hypothetical protein VGX23_23435 [Actinocrinis sp.]|nr:hypothetical protein [Actinocrinis sp.]
MRKISATVLTAAALTAAALAAGPALAATSAPAVAGPAGPCAGPLQFFSATYRPVRDSSISGLPPVFVN